MKHIGTHKATITLLDNGKPPLMSTYELTIIVNKI